MVQLLLERHSLTWDVCRLLLTLDAYTRVLGQILILSEVLGRVALLRSRLSILLTDVLLALGRALRALSVLCALHIVLDLG